MKSIEGENRQASYWDDILHEFGAQAYIEARYGESEPATVAKAVEHFGEVLDRAYGPEWRSTMEFTVNVSGTKSTEVYLNDRLSDTVIEAAQANIEHDLAVLDDWQVEDTDFDTDVVEVAVKFTGTTTFRLDTEDLYQLVEQQVTDLLGSDIEDIELEIEEA